MATENSRVLWAERTTGASIVTTELNALADDTAALVATALSNDASTERALLADFAIHIALQASARTGSPCRVALLLVPEVNSVFGDVATLATAANHVARYADGTLAYLTLDAAVTARDLTLSGIQLPPANFKVGLLNESGYALAATGNTIWMSGTYGPANVTV